MDSPATDASPGKHGRSTMDNILKLKQAESNTKWTTHARNTIGDSDKENWRNKSKEICINYGRRAVLYNGIYINNFLPRVGLHEA
jgi:hypothetical protein